MRCVGQGRLRFFKFDKSSTIIGACSPARVEFAAAPPCSSIRASYCLTFEHLSGWRVPYSYLLELQQNSRAIATACTSSQHAVHVQVLQVPIVKPKTLKKILTENAPRIPILGNSNVPTTDNTLEQLLRHVGTLFGKDPTKWEKVGE